MKKIQAVLVLGLAVGLASPSACARTQGVVYPAVSTIPSGDELNLDRLLSIYGDLGAALANVENVQDADLVAARVAVDFLLLRGMDQALTAASGQESHVSADFMRSFKTRREQAATAVENAIDHLRAADCYGSEALPAALSFSVLIGGQNRPGQESEIAVQELIANNLEMIAMLLEKAVDAESAEFVASLVESAGQYGVALEAYAQELGSANLAPSQLDYYASRRRKASGAISQLRKELESVDYHGSHPLRTCLMDIHLP